MRDFLYKWYRPPKAKINCLYDGVRCGEIVITRAKEKKRKKNNRFASHKEVATARQKKMQFQIGRNATHILNYCRKQPKYAQNYCVVLRNELCQFRLEKYTLYT